MLQFTFAGFEVQHIIQDETILTITASATMETGVCPSCGKESGHVHSYYHRHPQDLPISGRRVQLVLQVRRFRCNNLHCPRQTFAERLPELPLFARQTLRLGAILDCIAVVLSGQAGSQLTTQLSMPISPNTLLRRAKKPGALSFPTPRVLGVDDFAFRRGHTYGTLLLDLETHQPVDLLVDRTGESLAEWLKQHPGVEIISRDRSKDYQRGASDGAPQAVQVIDRWHLLKNLKEALERLLSHTEIPEEASNISPRQKRTSGERARAVGSRNRRLALYHQVVELSRQGGTIQGIARQLQISRQTVRKFLQAPSFPEWQQAKLTKSALDPYRSYLQQRWDAGCRTTDQLWQEVQERGFAGSRMMVYRWIQLQQDEGKNQSEPSPPKKRLNKTIAPRRLVWLLLNHPKELDRQERQTLSLLKHEPPLARAYDLAQQFVTMVHERNALPLATWLQACLTSGVSDLVSFAEGLEKEGPALQAALTLPYSNGPVEGTVNKLKYIKRSMYGRGGFPLLRQKVLKSA
jgi:transposase